MTTYGPHILVVVPLFYAKKIQQKETKKSRDSCHDKSEVFPSHMAQCELHACPCAKENSFLKKVALLRYVCLKATLALK